MKRAPLRCVVDTNVMVTANATDVAVLSCAAASGEALRAIMMGGHVFVDEGGLVVDEYRANLNARGQPGPGDAFFKWLLTNEWGGEKVTRVPITPSSEKEQFVELPVPEDGTIYDRSDRKFLAVAAAHPEHPIILQSLDSKWWGWTPSLEKIGVRIHFICEPNIKKLYEKKMKV